MWKNVDKIVPRLYDKGIQRTIGGRSTTESDSPKQSNIAFSFNVKGIKRRREPHVVRHVGVYLSRLGYTRRPFCYPQKEASLNDRGLVMSKTSNLFVSNYQPTSISPEDDVIMAIIKTRGYLAFLKDMLADDWKPREVVLSEDARNGLFLILDDLYEELGKIGSYHEKKGRADA